jgi:predicted dehydrogenase
MSLGALIVGLGEIGMGYDLDLDPVQYVYSHARAFSQHPAFHLVAAVDLDLKRRQAFMKTYKHPAYADIETALGQHQADLVVIATPTPLHKKTLEKVLSQSQPKVVMCEKPLSYDAEEGQFMVDACAAKGVSLYVNYMRRSAPGVIEVKRLLDTGEIEAPVKCVTWYSKGFLHNGSHIFNLLEYWLGPMQSATIINRGRVWGEGDPEPDVHVKFKKGEAVFLSAWEEEFSHYTVELLSRSGRLRCEQGGEVIQWQPTMTDTVLKNYRVLSTKPHAIESGMAHYQWHVVDQLARSINQEKNELCSGNDALLTLRSIKEIISLCTHDL